MDKGIIIAGSGGQGILLLGRLIAYTGMLAGKNVTWFPSYGAEMRGGTANCTVVISDEVVGSPIIERPDMLIILNCPSLKKFISRLKPEGSLIYDASLVSSEKCGMNGFEDDSSSYRLYGVNASDEASALGSIKFANMVLFGAFLKISGLANLTVAEEALKSTLASRHHHLIPTNLEAIRRGYEGVNPS